jgi:4'-phosphopantetheinyl transferase
MTAAHALAPRRAAVGIRLATLADVPPGDAWLAAEERATLARLRVPKRHDEWRLGRWVAKHSVMAWLGLGPSNGGLTSIVLRPDPHGAPDVLVDGVSGLVALTLSHRAGWALAAVGPPAAALGCDLESVEPRSPAFLADFLTEAEQILVATAGAGGARRTAVVWAGKESALKAVREGLRRDTRDVEVELPPGGPSRGWWPIAARLAGCGPTFHGWWRPQENLVLCVLSDPTREPPIVL